MHHISNPFQYFVRKYVTFAALELRCAQVKCPWRAVRNGWAAPVRCGELRMAPLAAAVSLGIVFDLQLRDYGHQYLVLFA